jgi:O-antigen ligase
VSWLLASVPVLLFPYAAALLTLGHLRRLSLPVRNLLFFFAATQLIAAMFTPRPLLSLGLAAFRTLVILAMISAGVYLQESRNLRPLLWGQVVVFVTAWVFSLASRGDQTLSGRLGHPYYYVVSLGLVAVVAIWLALFWRGGALWWRLLTGLLALVTFLAAGSRGPLLALVVGSAAALLFAGRKGTRRWILVPAGLALAVAIAVNVFQLPINPVARLLDDQTSGRNFVWADAYAAWQTSPIGGVGAYQGGPYITYLFKDDCGLGSTPVINELGCKVFNGTWLTAHNAWLHWLMETGVIGLIGLVAIYSYGLWAAARSRDPLLIAFLFGFTAMNLVDVVIALPSQHFSELFWVVLGVSVWRVQVAAAGRTAGVTPTAPNQSQIVPLP